MCEASHIYNVGELNWLMDILQGKDAESRLAEPHKAAVSLDRLAQLVDSKLCATQI